MNENRPETIASADRVVYMGDGMIVDAHAASVVARPNRVSADATATSWAFFAKARPRFRAPHRTTKPVSRRAKAGINLLSAPSPPQLDQIASPAMVPGTPVLRVMAASQETQAVAAQC